MRAATNCEEALTLAAPLIEAAFPGTTTDGVVDRVKLGARVLNETLRDGVGEGREDVESDHAAVVATFS